MNSPPPPAPTGDGDGAPATITGLLPALAAIGTLIVATLALVGASDVPSLTRGSSTETYLGAILLIFAVITAGLAAVFPNARRWLILGGYVTAAFTTGTRSSAWPPPTAPRRPPATRTTSRLRS